MAKRWTLEEKKEAIKLVKNGKTYEEIANILNKSKKSISHFLTASGESYLKYKPSFHTILNCLFCDKEYKSLKKRNSKFCSQSCNAFYNNNKRGFIIKSDKKCKNCDKNLNTSNKTFCNKKCFNEFTWKSKILDIENGNVNYTKNTYKKFLIYKYGNFCMECGWNKIHTITNICPIQLHHIDGNPKNNNLNNLILLCPNCHSLTENFGFLNAGKNETKCDRQIYRDKLKIKIKEELEKEYNIDIIVEDLNSIQQKTTVNLQNLKATSLNIFKPKHNVCECGNKKLVKSKSCTKCNNSNYQMKKVPNRPSLETLLQETSDLGFRATGRKYNVSDNCIRKWIKGYQ